ncbi:site-specific DNA methylase [Sphingobium cloacae]|uniref:Site-specific DNA methylase n=1 Tax=Sphingobium cloacae TaxID=120107 RepID=A0A1E1F2L2_9SPHN|nr:site-specific DNA methylase [Sphingobium cloacae]
MALIAQGSCGQFSLANAARVWTNLFLVIRGLGLSMSGTCPSSPPVRVSFKHGPTSSLVGLISNPRFYEHLMGWPIGWTAPEEPVTGFAVWLRRSRGALSRLLI